MAASHSNDLGLLRHSWTWFRAWLIHPESSSSFRCTTPTPSGRPSRVGVTKVQWAGLDEIDWSQDVMKSTPRAPGSVGITAADSECRRFLQQGSSITSARTSPVDRRRSLPPSRRRSALRRLRTHRRSGRSRRSRNWIPSQSYGDPARFSREGEGQLSSQRGLARIDCGGPQSPEANCLMG
jgi:hypothetical protein